MAEDRKIPVQVVTPYGMFIDEAYELVVLPTSEGEQGVMLGHVPFIAAVYPGELRLITGNVKRSAFVSAGYAEVRRNLVSIICNAAEWAEDIDIDRAKESRDRAIERLQNPDLPENIQLQTKHSLRRAKMRIKVAEAIQGD